MTRLLAPLLLLASTASAHFSLTLPKPLGDSDDNEATAPCGGYTASSSSPATDFYVDGDAIGMENGHPQTNWLFRATLDETAAGGWKQLFPIVMQTGLGNFCEPKVVAPGNWTGKRGVVSVVAHSPDGLLYTCAAVNFVSGTAPTRSDCKNATVTVDFTSDPSLTALLSASGSSTSSTPSSGSGSGSGSGSATHSASASSTANAAPAALVGNVFSAGAVAGLLVSFTAALGGAAMFF
ncbi:hypothetical protein CORC01_06370 [Colletotrichum orchidophilum]|uniref:Copper acquisition factor BIM1-like domain-containing protein n=1 Tax=Colletotrichum orchidophilum TaxID=1209926 RepID=A0A1G4BAE6_9PEZI|nr:uncharacterized protein CORC01_06370 [Colletotrichum orchidophilum]OHE98374.1 hypothetical protein CORC01_06370 [Colletotrichum orchidophilum]